MSAFPSSNHLVPVTTHPPPRTSAGLGVAVARARHVGGLCERRLIAHSVGGLRVSMGLMFVVFGALKLFPGVSPAQNLVETTTARLTLGLVHGGVALALVATLECVIGLALLSGRAMRATVALLGVQMIGILSPLVLMPGRLFAGPHGAPTLEGQYVIKDIVLVAVTLVLAATLGGARLQHRDHAA